jgi:hypothetical protein
MFALKPGQLVLVGALCFFSGGRFASTLTELLRGQWSKALPSVVVTAACLFIAVEFVRRRAVRV